jgi:hypothetical protein
MHACIKIARFCVQVGSGYNCALGVVVGLIEPIRPRRFPHQRVRKPAAAPPCSGSARTHATTDRVGAGL